MFVELTAPEDVHVVACVELPRLVEHRLSVYADGDAVPGVEGQAFLLRDNVIHSVVEAAPRYVGMFTLARNDADLVDAAC